MKKDVFFRILFFFVLLVYYNFMIQMFYLELNILFIITFILIHVISYLIFDYILKKKYALIIKHSVLALQIIFILTLNSLDRLILFYVMVILGLIGVFYAVINTFINDAVNFHRVILKKIWMSVLDFYLLLVVAIIVIKIHDIFYHFIDFKFYIDSFDVINITVIYYVLSRILNYYKLDR